MVQEKQTKTKMDFPNVLLYAVILCVHYPLRIWFEIYKLVRIVLIKVVSFPKQFLIYTAVILTIIEELLENVVINLLTYIIAIPYYLFETGFKIVLNLLKLLKNESQSNEGVNVVQTKTPSVLLIMSKRAVAILFVVINTFETYALATLFLPIKILLYSLKVAKNIIYTTLNVMETKSNFETTHQLTKFINWVLISTNNVILTVFDLITGTLRRLDKAIKTILNKCHHALLLSILVIFSIGEYLTLYLIFLFSVLTKSRSDNKRNNTKSVINHKFDQELERQNLQQEIANLKDALKKHPQIYSYEQQLIDFQKELLEANAKFDKEREQYKQEIEKLQQGQSDDNVQTRNSFNNERKKLQDEISQLQKLIAEVQKENEEENKLKKQEAIDLDNERNQLQEQIQNLQHEVVALQKQNETNALRYEELLKEQKDVSKKEQSVLEKQVQVLEDKVAELQRIENESKADNLSNHTTGDVQINNTDDDKKNKNLPSSNKKKKTPAKS